MSCVTGKRQYDTEQQALDGLISARSKAFFRENSGPINVYECDDCGAWHLTSKGAQHPILSDAGIQKNIKDQHVSDYWERKLRR